MTGGTELKKMDNKLITLKQLSEDYKNYDNTLYEQCSRYIKLYSVIDELLEYDEDYKEFINTLLTHIGVLLTDLNTSLYIIRNKNHLEEYISDFDRFNYKLIPSSSFAEITDLSDIDFKVHVKIEDVDQLDDLLNRLNLNIINTDNANHNLVVKLNKLNSLVNRLLSEYENDTRTVKVLNIIKNELRI